MMKNLKTFTPSEILVFRNHFEPFVFQHTFDFVYRGQVPYAALLLLEGKMYITGTKGVVQTLGPGSLLGVHLLLTKTPCKQGCRLEGKSQVILLSYSALRSATTDKTSPFLPLLSEF